MRIIGCALCLFGWLALAGSSMTYGQAVVDGAPSESYEPLHAWYDVNQSLDVWEGRTDAYDDEFLVDVRDTAVGSGPERGSSYPTNVETWAQFDDTSGLGLWEERVGGFTGLQNGLVTWEVRNGAGWDDGGGWTDEDGIGTDGIGQENGFTIIMAMNIHDTTSYTSVWNGNPNGPNDDAPILNSSTGLFNQGGTGDAEPGKGLLWLDTERDGYDTPVWVMDSGFDMVAGEVTLNEWQVHTFVYNDTESAHYVNGEMVASGDAGDLPMGKLEFWSTDGGWHRAADLDFAEGLFYDEVLSDGDRSGIEQYLISKWGIGPSVRGDFNNDGTLDAEDIDDLTAQSAGGTNPLEYDLTGDGLVNSDDVTEWIRADDIFYSWVGDANLDGEFNTDDLIGVLAESTYENETPAVWSSGDFNGNGLFQSDDLIDALADQGYEAGLRSDVASVPEPSSISLALLGGLMLWSRGRRQV